MSLTTACLAIGKTGCHATTENGLHQRFGCESKEYHTLQTKLKVQRPLYPT